MNITKNFRMDFFFKGEMGMGGTSGRFYFAGGFYTGVGGLPVQVGLMNS